eukprot:1093180-Karenia_brevis.AAC.1
MPPCNTTNIHDHNHPDFSITMCSPTSKHPHPARPPFTAIQAHYNKLPTHTTLTINIMEALPMACGTSILGREIADT